MSIISWIVLGLSAGLLANMLIPTGDHRTWPRSAASTTTGCRYETKRNNHDAFSAYCG